MLEMFSTAVPVLLMVTCFDGEELPTSTTENVKLAGLKETLAPDTTCRIIETVFALPFVTAKSSAPSLLKSPATAALGPAPTWKSFFAWNVPSPLPKNRDTELFA